LIYLSNSRSPFAPTPHQRERIHHWTRVAVPVIAMVSALANMCEFTAAADGAAVKWRCPRRPVIAVPIGHRESSSEHLNKPG
jgi:hypothetical protein